MSIHLIYLHGFDNSSQSVKATIIGDYCQQQHAEVQVHCPDLNMPPAEVIVYVSKLINSLRVDKPKNEINDNLTDCTENTKYSSCNKVCIVGSSLGGLFATILSNQLGVAVFLLNPCLYPEQTLIELFADKLANTTAPDNSVFYVTAGGWQVTYGDMRWTTANLPSALTYPEKISLLLTTGDEVIDYTIAEQFYRQHGVTESNIHLQQGNDHQISGFDKHLPLLMSWLYAV